MGSGTTGVACVKAGLHFVGVEITEHYFEITCERIRKAYAQPDMFVQATKPAHEQTSMFSGDAA
ncbi:Adenine specific DNA methylase Mod [Mycobacterium tuberculosis]|nr:Adenine specific DNA methylase Mod [Mycobacterium tuberculosis]